MSNTIVPTPTSRVRFGVARVDITPPVGIYHGFWGAARHHRSTGIHRPLTAEVMIFGPVGSDGPHTSASLSTRFIRVQLDLVGLAQSQHEDLRQALSEVSGLPADRIVISHSHSHAAGWFVPDRFELPGGELITPYLETLRTKIREACQQALAGVQDVTLSYAVGRCNLAANRDYWDAERGIYATGYNPDAPADDTVAVARVTDLAGQTLAVVVNYACHTTTLAWQNTRLSPDYVGAMREVVERATDATCIFLQGACGDLGPRDGFTGDAAIADRNGRQLGYAALSALESLGPPATDFHYQGPVISGATLGTWAFVPQSPARLAETARFAAGVFHTDLPLKPRPDPVALQQELDMWQARIAEADARGDVIAARDATGYAERARRWLARLKDLPEGSTYPLEYSVCRMGDAVWVTCGGEPYNGIQMELRRRFPELTVLFSPVAGALQVAYLLPRDRYGKGLYQEEPSILAPGCLETLTDAIAARMEALK